MCIHIDQPRKFRCIEFLFRILYENDENIILGEKICTILYSLPNLECKYLNDTELFDDKKQMCLFPFLAFREDIDHSKYLISLLSIIIYSYDKSPELSKLATLVVLKIDNKVREVVPNPNALFYALFSFTTTTFSVNCALHLLEMANRYGKYNNHHLIYLDFKQYLFTRFIIIII